VNGVARSSDVIRAYFDAMNAGDAPRAVACVAPDFLNEHTSSLGNSLRGRDAYGEKLPKFMAQFEGLHYELEDIIEDGDRVAVPYTMTFNWQGDDGASYPVKIRGMFRFVVRDGLIAHRTDYWDSNEFTRQTTPA